MKLANPASIFSKLIAFLKEVKTEAKKVNWPTREETIKDTVIVVVFSVAIALFLSLFDQIFQVLLNRFVL